MTLAQPQQLALPIPPQSIATATFLLVAKGEKGASGV